MEEPILTIKELYEWACQNGVENFTLFVADEGGVWGNCYETEIIIDKTKKRIAL